MKKIYTITAAVLVAGTLFAQHATKDIKPCPVKATKVMTVSKAEMNAAATAKAQKPTAQKQADTTKENKAIRQERVAVEEKK